MILVTGATGKIGHEAVRLLAAARQPVRVLVRDPDKVKDVHGVEVMKGDLDDAASIDRAVAGVDHVLLISPANAAHELAVIAAARRAGVTHIVKISSMGADTGSSMSIARGHGRAEEALKASGIGWTILRPGGFTQNLLGQAGAIQSQGAMYGAYGGGKLAYIDTRDIAAAAVKALTEPGHEGKTYVLTGPQALDSDQVAAILGAALGKPVRYVNLSGEQLKQSMLAHGLPAALADDLVALAAIIAAGHAATTSPDLERLLGHAPRTVADFARDHAQAFA